ncbi:tRNA pseudouridine55 synthase [Parelusimicrobium proximum]|uniref:tRNA pseudouridine(55) synthase TruB n=1 Tax=Parelusimicrobium proximum TaxID=3228953 RepID=UPI003D183908
MNPQNKRYEGPVTGLLLFDKPADWSSHDVVAVSRKVFDTKRVGHTGTLDPMATGLLIVLIRRGATRMQAEFLKMPKRYKAVARLGVETDSWDAYGDVTATQNVPEITEDDVRRAAEKLTGEFEQIIPPISAKKVDGKPMYMHAREHGNFIDKKVRTKVYEWEEIKLNGLDLEFTVHVAAGCYVRSLALMLAKSLGTTAHLTELRRLSIGGYSVDGAVSIDELKTSPKEELENRLIFVPPAAER